MSDELINQRIVKDIEDKFLFNLLLHKCVKCGAEVFGFKKRIAQGYWVGFCKSCWRKEKLKRKISSLSWRLQKIDTDNNVPIEVILSNIFSKKYMLEAERILQNGR